MNTVKLYDDDPYGKDFTAEVCEVSRMDDKRLKIVLDRTLFFPEEGGQSSDIGTLNGYEVTHVSIDKEGVISHEVIADDDAFKGGGIVTGRIDFKHRFSNMQNHSGEHILSGLLHSIWKSENVGFHLSDNIVTLDTTKSLGEDDLKLLERKANEIVHADIPVLCRYYSQKEQDDIDYRSKKEFDGEVRLVVIPGVDVCACCAPHVKHTGEIGLIKILKAINYKGGMRLTILSGMRAYEFLCREQEIVDELTHKLSETPEKLTAAVDRLLHEIEELKGKEIQRSREELEKAVTDIAEDSDNAVIFINTVDNISQRNAVNDLAKKHGGICAVFSQEGNDYRFIIAYPNGDARRVLDCLKEKTGAKGGGSKDMVQGSLQADRDDIESALNGLKAGEA